MTPQIDQHLTANGRLRKRDIILNNFLGGMAWGFGTVVGAGVVVGIIVYILRSLGVFDFLKMLIPPTI